jgi:hypothetical protein
MKTTKNKKNHNMCWTPLNTQTNTNNVNKSSYKQLEIKMNRTLFLCKNRNRHHNTELKQFYKNSFFSLPAYHSTILKKKKKFWHLDISRNSLKIPKG